MRSSNTAIIIGGGPAGLTAAYELLTRTNIKPIVIEAGTQVGGLSRTENYKGNRIDIGGHRFFSKSDRVMQWWMDQMPLQNTRDASTTLGYQQQSLKLDTSRYEQRDPSHHDEVLLLRERKSRIYHGGTFFDYPLKMSPATLRNLGLRRGLRIGASYLNTRMQPIEPERSLEDFFINRFGRELYLTFFKDYTEKVWGTSCTDISAEWGAQRIKGLSLRVALKDLAQRLRKTPQGDLAQKDVETSLIEHFLYPKLGPGQMWEVVANNIRRLGGRILMGNKVDKVILDRDSNQVKAVRAVNQRGMKTVIEGQHVFSTMPMRSLVRAMNQEDHVPRTIQDISEGLCYRDFITVGVLASRLKSQGRKPRPLTDNWIYIQEKRVNVGRLQIFNNWSPYLVADQKNTWLGLEYFCNVGDALWSRSDEQLKQLAAEELQSLSLVERRDILDSTVLRVKKTYPAYFGTYDQFPTLRQYLDEVPNLYLIGRNGMHRYNNQDHSMLAAMVCVDGLSQGFVNKEQIWSVNTEQEYHEAK